MSVRNRAIEIAEEVSWMPVEERVIVIDALLFSELPPRSATVVGASEIQELAGRLRAGQVIPADVERLAESMASVLPAKDRAERDLLIQHLVIRFGPADVSTGASINWLNRETATFEGGADWRRERHSFACGFADERRVLLWRILKFGDMPGRSSLYEILSH